jgi:two-component system sensor histidine kinase PilS (NtrC family)
MARWQSLSADSQETFWRSLQTLNATRVVIALVLLIYLSFDDKGVRAAGQFVYSETCLVYLAMAVIFALLPLNWRSRFLLQLTSQVAIDIIVISLLYLAAGGARSGLAILYLFPLAGAAILAPLVLSLLSASIVALFLIGESAYQLFTTDGETRVVQAGMYGAAFFAAVVLVSRLAAKLIRQEELAVKRGVELEIQQAINQIVIADVGDGILVVGRDGRIFAGNPAARQMLGLSSGDAGFCLADVPALAIVAQAFSTWLRQPVQASSRGAEGAAYVIVKPYLETSREGLAVGWSGRRDLAAHLKLRFARVHTPDATAERCVIFLQDVTAIENQAQQLKLASMGRLTASIAHEVRNPLSAIGHATALLAEDMADTANARLLKIIGDNVARVDRMVEDILRLSRKVKSHGEPLLLAGFLGELKAEFDETHSLASDIVLLGDTGPGPVRFDALHLREVVLNLLNNSVRYASGAPGSIRLFVSTDTAGHMELHVQDDGPGITQEVRSHLFEPFYTTSSKGTGLGLYLARELCLNNEAMLDYEYRLDASAAGQSKPQGRFVIAFARPLAARES